MAKKVLVVVTHATDDPDRCNGAMAVAASLLNEGADLALFLIFEGVLLAKKGVAETIHGRNFAPVAELFPGILEAEIPIYACGACVKTYGISPEEMIPGVTVAHAPTLAAEILERETVTL